MHACTLILPLCLPPLPSDAGPPVVQGRPNQAEFDTCKLACLSRLRFHPASPLPCLPYPIHQTLDPLSYKVDLDQLGRRSKGTKWKWETVRKWLDKVDNSRALCILAGEQEVGWGGWTGGEVVVEFF